MKILLVQIDDNSKSHHRLVSEKGCKIYDIFGEFFLQTTSSLIKPTEVSLYAGLSRINTESPMLDQLNSGTVL